MAVRVRGGARFRLHRAHPRRTPSPAVRRGCGRARRRRARIRGDCRQRSSRRVSRRTGVAAGGGGLGAVHWRTRSRAGGGVKGAACGARPPASGAAADLARCRAPRPAGQRGWPRGRRSRVGSRVGRAAGNRSGPRQTHRRESDCRRRIRLVGRAAGSPGHRPRLSRENCPICHLLGAASSCSYGGFRLGACSACLTSLTLVRSPVHLHAVTRTATCRRASPGGSAAPCPLQRE